MKKLVFLFAMIFAVSMAIAQNNESTIDQDGTGNEAEAVQAGLDNQAWIDQVNAVNNRAFIDQDGERNEATLNQSDASGTQELHHGTIDQLGNDNKATLDQSMWYGNVGHTGVIDQDGNRNEANLVMGGANNDRGTIIQEGDDNFADVDQMRGASGTSLPAIVEVGQYGNFNEVYMDQHSSSWAEAYIDQLGDENIVDLRQRQTDYADILQDGNNNDIWLDQHTSEFRGQAVDDPFEQRGDRNEVKGVDNNVGVTYNPLIAAYQKGSTLVGHQIGNDNKIGLYQNSGWGEIKQEGNENEALLYQNGSGLSSTILQTGDLNIGHVKQTDPGHLGNITQTGGENQAYIEQF